MKLSSDLNNDQILKGKDEMTTLLNKILDQETEGLIIRSRIRWAEEGGKSSRHLCNLEKRMGEKKSIFRLKNDNDDIITDQSKLLEEHLYKKQYEDDLDAIEVFLDSMYIFPNWMKLIKDFLEAPLI